MTRENKLALIVGFSLILVVAILITDHLSPAQNERIAQIIDGPSALGVQPLPPTGDAPTSRSTENPALAEQSDQRSRSALENILPLRPSTANRICCARPPRCTSVTPRRPVGFYNTRMHTISDT